MVVVRSFASGDHLPWASDVHGPDRDEPRRSRTFVAVDDTQVIGFGSLLWSNRHPDIVSAHINVHPDRLRRGIGTRMLHQLESVADRPIIWNLEPSEPADCFLGARGYEIAVTSVTSRIQVDRCIAELDRRPLTTPADVTVRTVVALDAALIGLYEEIYARCHRWAGRYMPPADAPWIQFAGPILPASGSIQAAYTAAGPCAVASLHTGPFADGADAFLAPTAALAGTLEERTAIVTHLFRQLLTAASEAGLESINIEHDSTYPELGTIATSLPSTLVEQRHIWMRR